MSKSNVLIQGDIGVGKTYSLRTLLPEYIDYDGSVRKGAGQHVRVITLEPGIESSLASNLCANAESFGIHYHYIKPLALEWSQFHQFMSVLNNMPMDKALEVSDPNRRQCRQLLDVIDSCGNFVCDRCGGEFGDAATWDTSVTLALDSLTGLTTVGRHLVVGLKPILTRPEYNPVMGAIEGFLQLFWGSTTCNTVLLAHIDREVNPITGISGITVHTIGQKLAPRLVKIPDEIITATYDEGAFRWNTELPGQITKTRRMPRGVDLSPDFAQIFGAT